MGPYGCKTFGAICRQEAYWLRLQRSPFSVVIVQHCTGCLCMYASLGAFSIV